MPESFVQNIGGEGRADLLFHCPVIGTHGELLIAVLFEPKFRSSNRPIELIDYNTLTYLFPCVHLLGEHLFQPFWFPNWPIRIPMGLAEKPASISFHLALHRRTMRQPNEAS